MSPPIQHSAPWRVGSVVTGCLVAALAIGSVAWAHGPAVPTPAEVLAGDAGEALRHEPRSALTPEFPTLAETGLPGFEVETWYGALAPAAG